MPRAKRPCSIAGCPTLLDPPRTRCAEHQRRAEQARGTKAQRGYGREHQARRREAQHLVALGAATCWRCGRHVSINDPWHLGHDDHDRDVWRGVECQACNLRAAGLASHGIGLTERTT